jgi:3-hydroxyisobutyrate dehydrogenase-like beta-hydroxyacid dehydrogenase
MTTIAFLGTGLMGTGFIQRARANGLTVRAWNRSAAKAQALAANDAAGVTACASVAEAVRGAERIHLSLADDASVDAVLEPLVGGARRADAGDDSGGQAVGQGDSARGRAVGCGVVEPRAPSRDRVLPS